MMMKYAARSLLTVSAVAFMQGESLVQTEALQIKKLATGGSRGIVKPTLNTRADRADRRAEANDYDQGVMSKVASMNSPQRRVSQAAIRRSFNMTPHPTARATTAPGLGARVNLLARRVGPDADYPHQTTGVFGNVAEMRRLAGRDAVIRDPDTGAMRINWGDERSSEGAVAAPLALRPE